MPLSRIIITTILIPHYLYRYARIAFEITRAWYANNTSLSRQFIPWVSIETHCLRLTVRRYARLCNSLIRVA